MTTDMCTLPRIIAICGAKRSGKDVLADYLVRKHGYVHAKFATPLKNVVSQLFEIALDDLESDRKDVVHAFWKTTPRRLMQFIGTDMMQFSIQECIPHVGRSFWAEKLFRDLGNAGRVVISDLRFSHEVDAIKRYSGGDYRIIRVVRGDSNLVDTHLSETELMEIEAHVSIENNSSIDAFIDAVESFIVRVRNPS